MALAGLDIATHTGIAVLGMNDERLLYAADIYGVGAKTSGQVFRHLRRELYELIGRLDITEVAAEEPLRTDIEISTGRVKPGESEEHKTRPPMHTFQRIYGLCAVAEEACEARGVGFRYVNQMTWRKAFTGHGRSTKEQTRALVQQIFRKNSITSLDVAEAVGVAWWLRGQLNPVRAGAHDDLFNQPSAAGA